MNILFWINQFPAVSETFIRDQVVQLAHNDLQARLYCSRHKNVLERDGLAGFEHYNFLKYTFDETDVLPKTWQQRKILVYLVLLKSLFNGHFKFYKKALKPNRHALFPKAYQLFFQVHFILEQKIDIIHAHFGNNGLQAAVLKDLGLPIKLITTFHGYDIRLGLKKDQNFYKPLFKAADAIIAISDYNRNHLINFGLPERKIVSLSNGVDLTFFKSDGRIKDAKSIKILSVARLEMEKSLDLGIRAIAEIIRLYPDYHFQYTIIGEGKLRPEIQALIFKLKLDTQVALLGSKTSTEVRDAMNQSDIFMLTSNTEVLPTVLLEAQACALPIIATDVGSVRDMVANGVIVEPSNLDALTNGLKRLLENNQDWHSMGLDSRCFVEANFNIEELTKKLIALYHE